MPRSWAADNENLELMEGAQHAAAQIPGLGGCRVGLVILDNCDPLPANLYLILKVRLHPANKLAVIHEVVFDLALEVADAAKGLLVLEVQEVV